MKPVLIVVDVQNDFIPPGGALAVPDGHQVVPVINAVADLFEIVVATQDWHPSNHGSFSDFGGIWPVHCVQDTHGAALHGDLELTPARFERKGADVATEGYSAFEDGALRGWLADCGADTLFFAGLATDYCVKASVLDGLKAGFRCYVIADGCRAVNVEPGDEDRAYSEMREAGATVIDSDALAEVLAV